MSWPSLCRVWHSHRLHFEILQVHSIITIAFPRRFQIDVKLFRSPISFVFKLNQKVTCLTKDKSIGRHPYRCLESCLVCPKCIINFHCSIFSRKIHCFLKNLLHFSIGDFSLPICLRVVHQSDYVLDSVFL